MSHMMPPVKDFYGKPVPANLLAGYSRPSSGSLATHSGRMALPTAWSAFRDIHDVLVGQSWQVPQLPFRCQGAEHVRHRSVDPSSRRCHASARCTTEPRQLSECGCMRRVPQSGSIYQKVGSATGTRGQHHRQAVRGQPPLTRPIRVDRASRSLTHHRTTYRASVPKVSTRWSTKVRTFADRCRRLGYTTWIALSGRW